ncbi:MAG: hypothetical protein HY275_04355 [Gemmatimonadetes bacterium]|nr:hypothetical protein [Gemmatimonadota bacterium]
MRTLRDAMRLLAGAASLDDLDAITTALGFAPGAPLDDEARAALGLGVDVTAARCATGPGSRRALTIAACAGVTLRDLLPRVAVRVEARAPHLTWLLVATSADGAVGVATWQGSTRAPRLAALVLDRARIVDADAETLLALAARREGADALVHAQWHEVLGRDALTRRFYRALEEVVMALAGSLGGVAAADARELALLVTCRLLFLAFVETKGWLDGDRAWLAHAVDRTLATGGQLHRRLYRPLFFGTLNTPWRARAPAARALGRLPFLNGGLFAPAPVERRCARLTWPDAPLARITGDLLARHRFTAREDAATGLEAAIDPEMLGRAFESLMHSRERRASGTFYTPAAVVETATTRALAAALEARGVRPASVRDALDGRRPSGGDAARLAERLVLLRVLDPACGSGAFLVHALAALATMRRACGDARPAEAIRREVLATSIFGVDVQPTAVWLCELRLWLAVVIESEAADPRDVVPLPNLDRHVRVGDALAGDDLRTRTVMVGSAATARLRGRYARASGARKGALARALDRAERTAALAACESALTRTMATRAERLATLRARDLFGERPHPSSDVRRQLDELRARVRALRERRRQLLGGAALPFAWAAHFPDAAHAGGFDVVVGNPPWVRLHNIPPAARERLRRGFRTFREAAWTAGAEAARAGTGFGAQVDLAALFVERSLGLLTPAGALALLVPAKLWRSLAGGGVRRLLAADAHLLSLDDWSDAPAMFDAATYPSLLVATRGGSAARDGAPTVAVTHHGPDGAQSFALAADALPFDASEGSPWLALPPAVRAAFDRLRQAGPALAASPLGRPLLGVKCGANDAFLVRVGRLSHEGAEVRAGTRSGHLEPRLLRPVLRGEDVAPWRARLGRDAMLWTHGADGAPLATLPPLAQHWLHPWRRRLASRSDARGEAWWTLFRTAAARVEAPRVVWADVARSRRRGLTRWPSRRAGATAATSAGRSRCCPCRRTGRTPSRCSPRSRGRAWPGRRPPTTRLPRPSRGPTGCAWMRSRHCWRGGDRDRVARRGRRPPRTRTVAVTRSAPRVLRRARDGRRGRGARLDDARRHHARAAPARGGGALPRVAAHAWRRDPRRPGGPGQDLRRAGPGRRVGRRARDRTRRAPRRMGPRGRTHRR